MRAAWALALALLLTAGCVTPASDSSKTATGAAQGAAASAPPTASAAALNATQAPIAATPSWWTLSVPASADGGLAGFRWTVPAGALHPFMDDVDGWTEMNLEFGPAPHQDAAFTAWSLEVFLVREGQAVPLGIYLSLPLHARTYLTPALTTDEEGVLDYAPFRMGFIQFPDAHVLDPGNQLAFVLTATGSGSLDLTFHVLPHHPGYGERAPATTASLVKGLQANGTGAPLDLAGAGSGFQVALYAEIADSLLPYVPGGILGARLWTDAASVHEALAADAAWPVVSAHDLRLGATFKADAGWGLGVFEFFGEGGAGLATLDTSVDGHKAHGTEPYVGSPALGSSAYYAVGGDGKGGTTASVHLQAAETNNFEALLFEHLDFGAPLSSLLGIPSYAYDSGSLLSSDPQARPHIEGNDLVLPGRAPTVLHGAARLLGAAPA
jgi:hypothetical protein